MNKRILLLLLICILLIEGSSAVTFGNKWKRTLKGIEVNTLTSPVTVGGRSVGVKWSYPSERVFVPYKQAFMPFYFKHSFPFSVDPCSGVLGFVASFAGDSIEVLWDYNVSIPNYDYDHNSADCVAPSWDCKSVCVETKKVCEQTGKVEECWNECVGYEEQCSPATDRCDIGWTEKRCDVSLVPKKRLLVLVELVRRM
ncbi:MAG: hypothetical protein ACTSPB_12580 [Candidatus Thorarchaeota archaeon]